MRKAFEPCISIQNAARTVCFDKRLVWAYDSRSPPDKPSATYCLKALAYSSFNDIAEANKEDIS